MIPGALVWATLGGSLLLAVIAPVFMLYAIIVFDFYWMMKVMYLSVMLVVSFRRYRATMVINWVERCSRLVRTPFIYHMVFISHASEHEDIAEATLRRLEETAYPKEKIIIIYAVEGRHPESVDSAYRFAERYKGTFRNFFVSVHPVGLPGELAVKGANLAYAGKRVKDEIVDRDSLPYNDIIVTTLDIDSCVEPHYFHYLTHTYLTNARPTRSSYQPIPMFHNNIWDAPAIMRVAATGTTFWLMAEQVRPERLCTFSSHSMPWRALVDVGFWQKDIVSDDSRIFFQCFLEYDGDYQVTPLYMPIYMDTVCAKSWTKSLINLFKQQQRWAWGSENIPYMLWHFMKARSIPLKKRVRYLFNQMEGMWSWGTAPLLIFFLGYAPLFFIADETITPSITVWAPHLLQWILSATNIGLILSVILGTIILPRKPKHHPWHRWLMMIIQWALLPLSTMVFGAFPAISAQTRLMLGKYLGFYVTEKTRPNL